MTTDAVDAWVSLKRIEEYLDSPEQVDCLTKSESIAFREASVAWPADSQEEDVDRFVLRDLNLEFPRNELSVITGKTGSGKSLLLSALLGEVDLLDGTIEIPRAPPCDDRFDHKATKDGWIIDSAVAYVAQVPWIENATIKANITFGLPLDETRYKKVLNVCALKKDLDMLEDGDMTDIGANGINLSGGQRWRVSFARALYSRAGILVLDDIFSAVDAHVGRQLFEQALTGELGRGRTRILVTHHVALCLPKTQYFIKLDFGKIVFAGSADDLRRSGDMEEILKDDAAMKEEEEAVEEVEAAEEQADAENSPLRLILSRRRSSVLAKVDDSTGAATKHVSKPRVFNEAEGREIGRIKRKVYAEYFSKSGGLKLWLPLMFVFLVNMVLPIGRSYWVTLWTRQYQPSHGHIKNPSGVLLPDFSYFQTTMTRHEDESSEVPPLWYYLGIYLALSIASVVVGTLKYFVTYLASLRASKTMFEQMSFVVLRAPLRWLDTVPVGRILNRFSGDFNQLDSRISGTLAFTLYRVLETVGITVAALFINPLMILVALVLFLLVFFIATFYLGGAREIKRLESNSKSPIFEQFGSVLAGKFTACSLP